MYYFISINDRKIAKDKSIKPIKPMQINFRKLINYEIQWTEWK